MRLYMPEQFRWGQTLELRDEAGRTRYTLSGDAYTLGHHLHILDLAGREAVGIRQRVPALFPTFDLEVYGKPVGALCKDLRFQPPRLLLEGMDWNLFGMPGGRDFSILFQNDSIAVCAPDRVRTGYLALELPPTEGTLTALGILTAAVVLA